MKTCKRALQIAAVALCILGFLALCREQLTQYIAQNKGLSQELVKLGQRKLPILAFCPLKPYDKKWTREYVSEEEYVNSLRNYNVSLVGKTKYWPYVTPIVSYEVRKHC